MNVYCFRQKIIFIFLSQISWSVSPKPYKIAQKELKEYVLTHSAASKEKIELLTQRLTDPLNTINTPSPILNVYISI